jgi:hypothetical protein
MLHILGTHLHLTSTNPFNLEIQILRMHCMHSLQSMQWHCHRSGTPTFQLSTCHLVIPAGRCQLPPPDVFFADSQSLPDVRACLQVSMLTCATFHSQECLPVAASSSPLRPVSTCFQGSPRMMMLGLQ